MDKRKRNKISIFSYLKLKIDSYKPHACIGITSLYFDIQTTARTFIFVSLTTLSRETNRKLYKPSKSTQCQNKSNRRLQCSFSVRNSECQNQKTSSYNLNHNTDIHIYTHAYMYGNVRINRFYLYGMPRIWCLIIWRVAFDLGENKLYFWVSKSRDNK